MSSNATEAGASVDIDQARKIVEREVMASKPDCVLLSGAERAFARCFVFFYQSKNVVATGCFDDHLIGHGPVLVSREDGKVFETGSAFSVEHYVQAFEACGDPYGVPTEMISISGWSDGANRLEAIKLIRANSALSLTQATAVVENALSCRQAIFATATVQVAKAVVLGLQGHGFTSMQVWRIEAVRRN